MWPFNRVEFFVQVNRQTGMPDETVTVNFNLRRNMTLDAMREKLKKVFDMLDFRLIDVNIEKIERKKQEDAHIKAISELREEREELQSQVSKLRQEFVDVWKRHDRQERKVIGIKDAKPYCQPDSHQSS